MSPALRQILDFQYPGWRHALDWDGDNREFVVECVLPLMTLSPEVRQVIRWAYGYDGEADSCEKWSDGSTVVKDRFFSGLAKDPYGVGHDYLHKLSHEQLATPDRKHWTFRQAADWYAKASREFGLPGHIALWRRFGLDLVAWPLWGPRRRKRRKFRH